MTSLVTVTVPLEERAYDVVIGPGAVGALPAQIPPAAQRAVVVTQPGLDIAVDTGLPTTTVHIPPGEKSKSLETVESVCRGFARAGLTRRDVVIGVGGGMVTDVAGLAASIWHRGTGVIHVATTLLAQIDAAIGGKTGVNLPEGKNLVGAFWQPLAVICDTDLLAGLPPEEWRSGRGEMVKYAFLGVEGLDQLSLPEQVARCVECKARVVAADEREGNLRMTLNYGHTLAHALEAAGLAGESGQAGLRHGEAVAIGLNFAARLARDLGRIDDARLAYHERLLGGADLPTLLPAGADVDQLLTLMARDKKANGDLTFVLDGTGGVEPVHGVDPVQVRHTLEGLCP
ncbi:MAG TPA: 3-dehydroquinate synthase family protein [Acidimicrobiales bacterium]|nr:3-dehydroquinate synthase family protein [Acidimicrobiales bacterium]